jgi:hypothetical protein
VGHAGRSNSPEKINAADRTPTTVGSNWIRIVQLLSPASELLLPQFAAVAGGCSRKSPGFVPPNPKLIVDSDELALLATVTVIAAVGLDNPWLPNAPALVRRIRGYASGRFGMGLTLYQRRPHF